MQALIADLLAYSQAGTQTLNMTRVDMGEVVAEVLGNVRPAIEESGAVIEIGELPVLEADRMKVGPRTAKPPHERHKISQPRQDAQSPHRGEAGDRSAGSKSKITGSVSTSVIRSESSRCFNGCTTQVSIRAPELGSPFRSGSSRVMAAESGRNPPRRGRSVIAPLPTSRIGECEPETLAAPRP